MNVIVLGGTGYLGSSLINIIFGDNFKNKDVNIYSVSRYSHRISNPFSKVHNVTPLELLERVDSDIDSYIVNLANSKKPLDDIIESEKDLAPIELVCRLYKKIKVCKVIHISSGGHVYGLKSASPISEISETLPITSYGILKLQEEIELTNQLPSDDLLILRLSNPVGERQLASGHGLVTQVVMSARKNKPVSIYGAGNNYRDYFLVDSFCELIFNILFCNNWHSGVYNIGSGVGYTELEIIHYVERVIGKDIEVNFLYELKSPINYSVLDVHKAAKYLGWNYSLNIISLISQVSRQIGCKHF